MTRQVTFICDHCEERIEDDGPIIVTVDQSAAGIIVEEIHLCSAECFIGWAKDFQIGEV